MPDLPESVTETAAPEQLMQALEIFRQRYQQGLMTAREFREMLNLFQFTDEVGHLWSPGANTGQWYRWDRSQWTAAAPPARLKVSSALSASPHVQIPPAQPPPPVSPVCAGCAIHCRKGPVLSQVRRPVSAARRRQRHSRSHDRRFAPIAVTSHSRGQVPAHCGQEVSIRPTITNASPRRCPNPQANWCPGNSVPCAAHDWSRGNLGLPWWRTTPGRHDTRAGTRPAPVVASYRVNSMQCNQCGTKTDPGDTYCGSCGASLQRDQASPTKRVIVAALLIAFLATTLLLSGSFPAWMSPAGESPLDLTERVSNLMVLPETIAFCSDRTGDWEVYVMQPDGSDLHRLTNSPADDGTPAWSPDKSQLAFTSNRDGNWEIYIVSWDGSGLRRLTNHPADDGGPTWSPDGRYIAFSSDREGNYEIYVMDVAGGDPRRLTNDPGMDTSPAWSPDGERIAFNSTRSGNWEIHVMRADGSDVQQLTFHPADDWRPAWSPDGQRLAFSSMRDGNWEIYVMAADGSGLQRLTDNPAMDWRAVWSPDGQRLAFISERDGNREVYVMRADGSEQKRLTNDPGTDCGVDW